ncbi:P-loop containing nucleoside triphosphate hydrolase protein [Piedraia hortae CBS 480.64]|uniref:P-loop containing nucleoside triphosphate hydrolase protein n=1 Tax=Piedraia hortae CBS 480.64 TaxID=1314780 RepID=A0A6A7BTA4_9PEZI|nr:P-loop containing nucleoside triphosphate hydrolase protein [Piedraia hortae CBS 480.64]
MESAEYGVLSNVLLGRTHPTPASIDDLASGIQWYDPNLNDGQKEAIRFALASREVALIHGPPGTGKTHTLVELIRQLIARDQRLLVCGPSNISVDNIVERLSPHKVSMVRLGHPARLLPTVLNHSLDVLSKTSDAAAIVSGIRAEMDAKQSSIRKTRNGKERRAIYGEMRELRKELRQRESRVVGDLLRSSKVALSTLHGAGSFHLKNERFDVIIVDEASQALEAQCWIPIIASGAPKLVLAGDHLQLPPTIKSLSLNRKTSRLKNKMGTLETTLFDRLLSLYGNTIKCMLTMQYRMHQQIMAFPSAALYEDRLVAAASVKDRLLNGLPYAVQDSEDTKEPLVFWDTQGGDFPEQAESDSDELTKGQLLAESKVNEQEAALARLQVANLIGAGVRAEDIAVVTPYNGQLGLLSSMLKERYPGIELGSVDGFQGREKEAVIVSLVRSNSEGEVGFLGEKRRLNGEPSSYMLHVELH